MKIICAPDSFKESLTARQAAQAMRQGILTAMPTARIDLCPIADGGEGTVDAMLSATQGHRHTARVLGPLGQPVTATWGMLGPTANKPTTAVIEMAAASGLALVPADQRDPTRTTTFGTGELIRCALDAGAGRVILGIGGSATNDGGCGAAQALGVRFFDAEGRLMDRPMTGGDLGRIARIDMHQLDPRLADGQAAITLACDVRNPLVGPSGAAVIYGPQKGATPRQVESLDAGLGHLAALLVQQLGKDVQHVPGSGAAGGMGGGLLAMLDAKLQPGVEMVLKAIGFDARVADCDLCLTGEGRLDGSSLTGKACLGVAAAAGRHQVPTIALVGSAGPGAQQALTMGLHAYHEIGQGLPVKESMRRAEELLIACTSRAVESWLGRP